MSIWTIFASLFLLLLLLNVFIRVRVLRLYRRLVKDEVDFQPVHFFNQQKLEEEVLPNYPEHKEGILKFIKLVRFSMTMASIIIILILVFGYKLLTT